MNERKERDGDRQFEEKARRVFRDSVAALDAETLSRLNRARQKALAEIAASGGAPRRMGWRPAAGLAAVAILAVGIWLGQMPGQPTGLDGTVVGTPEDGEDLEIVLQDESLDMLAELEFYDWVDSAEGFHGAPPGAGNIG